MICDVDVVVVGAGPAGLLLAGDLARAGVGCAVLERRAGGSGLTRAFTVHTRTLEQLDARGVADELVASGSPVRELRVFASAGLDFSGLPSRFPYVLVTPQYQTERVLEERARALGADIRYRAEVTGLTQLSDGVEVKVRDDDHLDRLVRSRYVVGADGVHSTVRRALGMPFPGQSVVRSVMLADVQLTRPLPVPLTVNATGNAFALIASFGDGWYRVIAWQWSNQPPEDAPVSLTEVRDATRQALGADFGMHDPRWMSRFHSDERQVPRYRDGRVLLAGDAAHVHSPAGGMGMNTGIQDAANLGWKLAATVHGWAPGSLLDTYQAERHPVGRRVLRVSGALLRIGLTTPPALVGARNVLAYAATRTPISARLLAGTISAVSLSYRPPRGAHPLTGKRVADLPLADGRRLYQALRGGSFLLAAGAGVSVLEAARGYDGRVEAVTLASKSGTVALIRPDAYIAWADSDAADGRRLEEVRGALARCCGIPVHAQPQPTGTRTLRARSRAVAIWCRRSGRLGLGLQGVVDRLRVNQAVSEHERIDAVVGASLGCISRPLHHEHVVGEDLPRLVPGRVGQVGQHPCEGFPDAVLAVFHASGRDHYGVIGEIGSDPVDVRDRQRLAVMGEGFLRRARHRICLLPAVPHIPPVTGMSLPVT
jgi:2-polyprenyl-6-methoxyphenol hydroxylase-like FAD-dependent oxidoreductase